MKKSDKWGVYMVIAKTIRNHFINNAPWVDRKNNVDKIRFGNPDKLIKKIGTGWSACRNNLKEAAKDNCDLFISHEVPLSDPYGIRGEAKEKWYKERYDILKETDMVLMNLHDTWDHWPEYGIRDSWSQFLKLGKLIKELDYIHPGRDKVTTGRSSIGIYKVSPPVAVREMAKKVAVTISSIGENGVSVMGNLNDEVNKVAVGVGCHIPGYNSVKNGADLLIMVYDRANQLNVRIPLVEKGANIIVLEHSTAEIPAMKNMKLYLEKAFPGINACFYNREPEITTFVSD